MKIWRWLLVGIGIFILGFVLGHLFWGTYSGIDEYKVFRDTLTLTLSFSALAAAVLGLVIHRLISQDLDGRMKKYMEDVETRAERAIKEKTDEVVCRIYMDLSLVYWKDYEVDYIEIDGRLEKPKQHYLNLAIEQSENALKVAERLNEKKFGRLRYMVKNNLAYHLAVRGWPDDAKRAIPLAEDAYNKRWDYDYKDTCKWVETYAFVLIKLGSKGQQKEGVELVKGTLKRGDLPTELKQYIEKKYKKILN